MHQRPAPAADGGHANAQLETPCYLLDPAAVVEDYKLLKSELGTGLVASLKASPTLDLLVRCQHELVDGIEIASLGELNLTVGRITVPRFVNTPAMDLALIGPALACKATLVADSPRQLRMIAHAAASSRHPVRLALRINAASLAPEGARRRDHFGMDVQTLFEQLDALRGQPLKVAGFHVFDGSNTFRDRSQAIAEAMEQLVGDLAGHPSVDLQFVNLGGGIPARWQEQGIDFARYRERIAALQRRVTVLHEAGRALFSRSGKFMTRVIGVKRLDGESVAVCDGGMAQCFALAQTEDFVKRPRAPTVVRADAPPCQFGDEIAAPVTLVGSSCNRADVIGRVDEGSIRPGDLLVFDHSGAYYSYSPTTFLNLRAAPRYIAS